MADGGDGDVELFDAERDAGLDDEHSDRHDRIETPELTREQRRALHDDRRKRRRRGLIIAVALLLVIVLPFLVGLGWFWYQLDPPGDPGAKVSFEVRDGWGTANIGDALESKGVIGSSLAFQIYAKVTRSGPFRAGTYQLHEDLGVRQAVHALEQKPAYVHETLALPPGMTLSMIAERVGKLPGRSAARFLDAANSGAIRSKYEPAGVNSLEGLTWPDTYFVDPEQSEAEILQTLVTAFDQHMDALGIASKPLPAGVTPYQALVAASLIQTEAKLDEDRPLIAAVIYNRLKAAMPLQIDATVLYARGHRDGPITKSDLALQSPYNTYVNQGLPPTPISTLTPQSIDAAFNPADVTYLYYVVADANGKHAFANTFAEHEQNVAAARAKGLIP